MARLGSEKRPVVLRVRNEERAQEVTEICYENGWHYIIGIEPYETEDIRDLEKLLGLSDGPIKASDKPGRNDPCVCGSGKKYKKCCGKPT